MAKRGVTPTDREAGYGADTNRRPRNIEEQRAVPQGAAEMALPRCETCQLPAIQDPKRLHKCARCRSELLPEVAVRRGRERKAAAEKEAQERAERDERRRR